MPTLARRVIALLSQPFGSARIFLLVLIVAVASGGFLISQRPQPCDDAYITFRHVRNLIEYGRPSWNLHGVPVLGSTSPGYMFALAGPAFFFGSVNLDWIALGINGAFHVFIVVFAFLTLRDFGCGVFASLMGSTLVGVNSVNLVIFAQGFENAMFTAVMLAAFYCASAGERRLAVVLASLAPLVRPEGVIVSAMVWGALLLRRRARWGFVPLFLLLPVVWAVFASAYYGSPIPHSLWAMKQFPAIYYPYQYHSVDFLGRLPGLFNSVLHLWQDPAGPLLVHGLWKDPSPGLLSNVRYSIVVAGAFLSVGFALRARAKCLVYVLFPPLFLILFALLAYTKPWYYPSFVTSSLIAVCAGWFLAIERFSSQFARRWPHVSLSHYQPVCILAVVLLLLSADRYGINRGQYDYAAKGLLFARHPFGKLWELWEDQRYYQYRSAAELLNARSDRDATALITEVGVFGFFYRGAVLDTVGLCSPEALRFYPPPPADIFRADGQLYSKAETFAPTAMILELRPDFVVNSRAYLARLFRDDSQFLHEYVEIAALGKIWGEPLLIYERRDRRPPDDH
ncbi:MAG: hypothetical protein Q7R41_20495 [Phycisphaerales bacterium]|nr:hypothetical protein [Phycisphaerales bacterium]